MNKPWKILLTEDDVDDRFFFELALKEISIPTQLTIKEDGEKLLDYLTDSSNPLPDIIFLDINLPKKNGIEALAEIKNNEELRDIPVIMYSTLLSNEIADELYEKGASYYLQKCDYTELAHSIEKIFSDLKGKSQRPSRKEFVLNN